MPVLALIFVSQLVLTVANGPPTFDVNPTCRAAESVDLESPKSCQEDEQAARENLVKQWKQFSASDQTLCSDLTDGYNPSYVELLSCLETMRGANQLSEDSKQPSDK